MRTKFQIMRARRNASAMKKIANAYDVEKARERAVLMGVSGLLEKRSMLWPSDFYDAKTNGDLNQYRLGSRFGDPSIQNSSGLSSSGLGLGLMGCHSQPLAADCSAYNIKGPGGVQFQQHPSKAGVDADLHHPPVLSNVIPRAPKHWLSSVFELISVQLRKAKAYLAHCAKKALG